MSTTVANLDAFRHLKAINSLLEEIEEKVDELCMRWMNMCSEEKLDNRLFYEEQIATLLCCRRLCEDRLEKLNKRRSVVPCG